MYIISQSEVGMAVQQTHKQDYSKVNTYHAGYDRMHEVGMLVQHNNI